ncbi:L,D-transpeptidase [Falsihalocynthiibacter sp. SS001]|uniref:L,D-transpeptidase n=1 Tax=Falsihalocynthiibacter sp. SS001 TaxID=3349698 RepID=UPI0036D235F1
MSISKKGNFSRRSFIGTTAAFAGGLATPALAQIQVEPEIDSVVKHNISSFRSLDWRPYFSNTRNGAILVDTKSRALHYWSEDRSIYKLYPTSVPMSDELTRLGRTSVIRKVEGPSWAPTPSMKRRNPEWPDFIGPGPDNPMGTHALYLSWTYYRIHGTQDTRKIGRRSSNGCIGLYNEHIAVLFGLAKNGTQVLLI